MTLHQRKLNRLSGYDYSQNGKYFVTICTYNRKMLFGNILENSMILNECGKIVKSEIDNIPAHYENIFLDTYVIMPNHLHFIISIQSEERINQERMNPSEERINPFPTLGIPDVIGKFKAGVTRRVGKLVGNAFMRSVNVNQNKAAPIWQKSYHDHIIRNETEYLKIYEYIIYNPEKWENDCFFA